LAAEGRLTSARAASGLHSIAGNGSVNIGESFHNSHTANSKSTGSNASYGDRNPTSATMKNMYVDPGVNDQTEIGNMDSVHATQA